MSETISTTHTPSSKRKPTTVAPQKGAQASKTGKATVDANAAKRAPRPRKTAPDLNSLRDLLKTFDTGVTPTVHLNGLAHGNAVLVVDFGSPLVPVHLNSEQTQEMTARMKELVTVLASPKTVTVRVNSDLSNGVFWVSTNNQ